MYEARRTWQLNSHPSSRLIGLLMYATILKAETASTPPNGPALGRCKTGVRNVVLVVGMQKEEGS